MQVSYGKRKLHDNTETIRNVANRGVELKKLLLKQFYTKTYGLLLRQWINLHQPMGVAKGEPP